MALEELDDIAEEMASKLGIYGEERSYWVSEFTSRVRKAFKLAQIVERERDRPECPHGKPFGEYCGYCASRSPRQG
jgi:hypothetical protein